MNIEKEIAVGMSIKNPYLESKSVCDNLSEYEIPSKMTMPKTKTPRVTFNQVKFFRFCIMCLICIICHTRKAVLFTNRNC